MITLRNILARWCERVASAFTEGERRLRVCPDCGRNCYYGKACK